MAEYHIKIEEVITDGGSGSERLREYCRKLQEESPTKVFGSRWHADLVMLQTCLLYKCMKVESEKLEFSWNPYRVRHSYQNGEWVTDGSRSMVFEGSDDGNRVHLRAYLQ